MKKLIYQTNTRKTDYNSTRKFCVSGTIKDNITMGEVAEDSEVAKYLEKVGLTQKDFLYSEVEVHGKNLSGGQRQKIGYS